MPRKIKIWLEDPAGGFFSPGETTVECYGWKRLQMPSGPAVLHPGGAMGLSKSPGKYFLSHPRHLHLSPCPDAKHLSPAHGESLNVPFSRGERTLESRQVKCFPQHHSWLAAAGQEPEHANGHWPGHTGQLWPMSSAAAGPGSPTTIGPQP